MSKSYALTIPKAEIQKVEQIATECRNQLANVDDQFAASFALAELTTALDKAITPQMMQGVMSLKGHALGFKTDLDGKPNDYDIDTVRPAFIEATVRGFRPVNNEWNIIAGRFYGCKNGFERVVKTFPGVANFTESMAVPEISGASACVSYVAKWELDGKPMSYQRSPKKLPDGTPFDDRIVVRVNSGMGHDAIMGKAYRKAYAGIYNLLTGNVLPTPEGDVADDALVVDSKPSVRQSGLFSDDPPDAPDEAAEGLQADKLNDYRKLLDQCEKKTDVGALAKAAGADKTLSVLTRTAVMDLCTERRKEL